MVLTLTPLTALAKGPAKGYYDIGGDEDTFYNGSLLYVYENKKSNVLYRENKVKTSKQEGISYSLKTNTLTLDNYKHPDAIIYIYQMGTDFTIKVKNDCSVGMLDLSCDNGYSTPNGLKITGNGTLTVNKNGKNGEALFFDAYGEKAKIVFDKYVTVKLYAGESKNVLRIGTNKYKKVSQAFKFANGVSADVEATPSGGTSFKAYGEIDYKYLGYSPFTNKDDKDAIYLLEYFEQTNEYRVERYIYSKSFDTYFQDPNYGELLEYADGEPQHSMYTFIDRPELHGFEIIENGLDKPVCQQIYLNDAMVDEDGNKYGIVHGYDGPDVIYDAVEIPELEGYYYFKENKEVKENELKMIGDENGSYDFIIGSKKYVYTGAPAKSSVKKLTKGKKSFKVNWKKVSAAKGYELQYSTSKKFAKKNTKTITVKKNSTTSKTVKKLKKNKKYYVRIRTFKTVGGKKIYSDWSKAKTVKTKK